MPVVKIEPTAEHPLPYRLEDEEPSTFLDELSVSAATADLLESLGAPPEVDPTTYEREKSLLEAAVSGKNAGLLKHYPTALAASAFLKEYGQALAADVVQVRSALTNKLMELANCGEPKYELKAIELLGKHSDIGLFTERSEININYNSPEALESAITERVKRLLNADVIDITPLDNLLEDELGVFDPSAGDEPHDEAPDEYEDDE